MVSAIEGNTTIYLFMNKAGQQYHKGNTTNTWSTILIADYIYSTNLVNYEFRLCRAYSVNVLGVSLITIFNEGAFLMSFPLAINKHTNLSHP